MSSPMSCSEAGLQTVIVDLAKSEQNITEFLPVNMKIDFLSSKGDRLEQLNNHQPCFVFWIAYFESRPSVPAILLIRFTVFFSQIRASSFHKFKFIATTRGVSRRIYLYGVGNHFTIHCHIYQVRIGFEVLRMGIITGI
jgi:hypothetical protein